MPYLVEKDTNLPRVIAAGTGPDGNEYQETESVVYDAGAVVYEQDIAPAVLERLEAGDDDHLSSLVKHISESEAEERQTGSAGAVAPEHEAEAEVLYQGGKDVLTHDEVVELNQQGDPEVVAEEAPDLSEDREAGDPDSPRVKEVDQRRRGEAEAPKSVPAASESDDGESQKSSDKKSKSDKSKSGSRPKGEQKAEAGSGQGD